jgi:protein-L-isoaspartate(D-aspartate) O-methyltransferase
VTELAARRRFYAEDIQILANLQTASLIEALAEVPRERFLPPGPWTYRAESDMSRVPRVTPDADPRWLYHNVGIALDPARQLFNGAPGILALAIDALALEPGARALHIGTGPGYYTALMAHCAGPAGRVLGIEVDPAMAASARTHLAAWPSVEVLEGDGRDLRGGTFDAILINAGVTHPLPVWLDALAPGGRLVLPLTATMPGMGPIGKGLLVLISGTPGTPGPGNVDPVPRSCDVRMLTFVAIYSALGLRNDDANRALGMALQRNPFPQLKSLRRDAHEPGPACWLHTPEMCWSL